MEMTIHESYHEVLDVLDRLFVSMFEVGGRVVRARSRPSLATKPGVLTHRARFALCAVAPTGSERTLPARAGRHRAAVPL